MALPLQAHRRFPGRQAFCRCCTDRLRSAPTYWQRHLTGGACFFSTYGLHGYADSHNTRRARRRLGSAGCHVRLGHCLRKGLLPGPPNGSRGHLPVHPTLLAIGHRDHTATGNALTTQDGGSIQLLTSVSGWPWWPRSQPQGSGKARTCGRGSRPVAPCQLASDQRAGAWSSQTHHHVA
jgi:hypothetical protein